jgi:hypothetical protein
MFPRRLKAAISLAALLITLTCFTTKAQHPSPAGSWEGLMITPDETLRFRLSLQQSPAGAWSGSIQIPSQGPQSIPLANLVIIGDAITFEIAVPNAPSLSGRFLNDGTVIEGGLKQDPRLMSFRIARSVEALQPAPAVVEPITLADIRGSLDDRPFFSWPQHPAIQYSTRPATDRVALLNAMVQDGKVHLNFDERSGYLRSILEALKIPVESQMVVFSKTSVQAPLISAANPRALFFTDDVTVGFIKKAPFLEFAAQDPQQGVAFYTLDQREVDRPEIRRRDSCLSCHESRNSLDVPGLLTRSIGVSPSGDILPQLANFTSDHRSPFDERWGGWYVTGKAGSLHHLGNSADSLQGKIDASVYPSVFSDIAALLVFNHQTTMSNMLTRVGWEIRAALYQEEKTGTGKDITAQLLANDAKELVDYMLFVDEAQITGTVQTTSGFAETFARSGPFDRKGRTLRQLSLEGRLMKFPCSYMIYSAAFDSLPSHAKEAVYQRLWDVLSGNGRDAKYARKLSPADREAIVQILRDTKPDLPAFYQ